MGGVVKSIFGGDQGKAEARRQQAEARKDRQDASEDAARQKQTAERGGSGGRTRGRDMLVGNLSNRLKTKLGG